ncbi:hypothetical protein ATO10_13629 [Actibacterium atlanticum]|uniref:Uncharacterized protein n=1 Tax=Actibacterium atlanticum TaxID=1461693 RepID=A0A058ZJ58_9RHOB|nr:hypothetical protein [Actibacterium atlanticum]KCV81225.1 hypothetical protein ATO10_13629 [Actibacterium atlanticum]
MRLYVLALLIPLAACATPREKCEQDATQDLKVVSALIVETRQNIERGYAVKTEVRARSSITWCVGDTLGSDNNVALSWCSHNEPYEVDTPVAIDVSTETAKLKSLLKKRDALEVRAKQDLQNCASAYPEA